MSTNTKPVYPVTVEDLGFLKREEVTVVHVPREHFMQIVERTIEEVAETYGRRYCVGKTEAEVREHLRTKLLPVAKEMPTFPMGTWINTQRGCGCVVGEYLIAADIIERTPIGVHVDVYNKLHRVEDGDILRDFGSEVDTNLRAALIGDEDWDDEAERVVWVLGSEAVLDLPEGVKPENVKSLLIED